MSWGESLPTFLWAVWWLSLVAILAGVVFAPRWQPTRALAVQFAGIEGILVFSYIAGFSYGRWTASIAVLGIGYMVAVGAGGGIRRIAVALLVASASYWVLSWLLTPLTSWSDIFRILFGSWGIPIYLAASIAGFLWSIWRVQFKAFAPRPNSPRPRY